MFAALLLALMSLVAVTGSARADGYPHSDAVDCSAQFGTYSWCEDENGNGSYSSDEQWSSRGYGYRNCTDYVAWKLESLGVSTSLTRGRGNGAQWNDNGTGVTINNTPAYGAAAVNESVAPPYGHVSFVEDVYSNGTVKVSEYNYGTAGNYGTRVGTPTQLGITNFVHFGVSVPGSSSSGRISLLDAGNAIWAKDSLGYGGWSQQTGNNSAKAIAVGGNRQVLIDLCDAVWSKDSLGLSGWTQETACGSAKDVRVSSTGLRVILDFCGAVYAKDGAISYGGWVQQAGCGSAKDVQVGGNRQVILDNCDAIWSKDTFGNGGWTQEAGCGAGKAITVSSNGMRIITNYCDALWAKSGGISNGGWTQETSCGSVQKVAAGSDVQVIVDFCGAIYAKNNGVSYGGWTQEAGCSSAKAVSVGSNGRQAILSLDNAIWAKDSFGFGGWGQQTDANSANMIAVG